MSVWTEDQFASRAKDLAKAHVGAKTPLNDLLEKVAREAELTPDAIRTLGRFTNVAVFQEMFSQKAASADPDRIVEFEPGDPEVVIHRVVKSAQIQADARPADVKVASEIPDLMRQVRGYATELEKEAAYVDAEERQAPKPLQTLRLRKMADELGVTVKAASQRWDDAMAKLASAFKRAPGYGPSYEEFEKAALAEWGRNAVPELTALRQDLRLPKLSVSSEKIASFSDRHVSEDTQELRTLSSAISARENYQIMRLAHAQVMDRLK